VQPTRDEAERLERGRSRLHTSLICAALIATSALEKIADMTTGQIEKRFPRYALAYIRFLAGERDIIPTPTPTPTPAPICDGITPAEIPAVQRRVVELLGKVDLARTTR
jgi:hypothetical protein